MNNYIRNGAKVLYNYALSLLVFGVFVYVFISMAGNSLGTLLPLYCFVIFLLAFFIIYSDIKKLAAKEKRPQYDLKPYPLKGLVYGLIGFLPVALLEIISVFIVFDKDFANNLKHLVLNFLMGPLFFIIKPMGESFLGYFTASLVIPVVSMLGYLAGYYDFNIIRNNNRKAGRTKNKGFEKSPWNPTNRTGAAASGKKKTKQSKTV